MSTSADDRRGVIVCPHAMTGRLPILYARRDEPVDPADSGWQAQCGSGLDDDPLSFKLLSVSEVLAIEPTLEPYLDSPYGTSLRRASPTAPWMVTNEPEGE